MRAGLDERLGFVFSNSKVRRNAVNDKGPLSTSVSEYNSQMPENDLSALSAFVVVAEERSFTRAARRLGISPSAMSHAMRGLEERVGVRLLSRTTRSVAPTDAGQELLAQLRPALSEVHVALDRVAGLRKKPAGRVRLLVPRFAAGTVLAPSLASSRANTRTSCSTSPRMTVAWISLLRGSTQASTSASTSKRT